MKKIITIISLISVSIMAQAVEKVVEYFPSQKVKIANYNPSTDSKVRIFFYGMFYFPHGAPESKAYFDMKDDSYFDVTVSINSRGEFLVPALNIVYDNESTEVRLDGVNVMFVLSNSANKTVGNAIIGFMDNYTATNVKKNRELLKRLFTNLKVSR